MIDKEEVKDRVDEEVLAVKQAVADIKEVLRADGVPLYYKAYDVAMINIKFNIGVLRRAFGRKPNE